MRGEGGRSAVMPASNSRCGSFALARKIASRSHLSHGAAAAAKKRHSNARDRPGIPPNGPNSVYRAASSCTPTGKFGGRPPSSPPLLLLSPRGRGSRSKQSECNALCSAMTRRECVRTASRVVPVRADGSSAPASHTRNAIASGNAAICSDCRCSTDSSERPNANATARAYLCP